VVTFHFIIASNNCWLENKTLLNNCCFS